MASLDGSDVSPHRPIAGLRRRDAGKLEFRKVSVPLCVKGVPHLQICWWIQGPSIRETLHEIRIAEERPAEGDKVSILVFNGRFRGFLHVPAIPHKGPLEHLPKFGQRHRRSQFVKAERQTIHHVEVRKSVLGKLSCRIQKSLTKIRRAHVVEITVGRDVHPTRPDGQTVRIALTTSSRNR